MPEITIEAEASVDKDELIAEVLADKPWRDRPDHDGPVEFLVPIVLFLAVAATYCLKYYFTYRGRQEAQKTVRVALERGDPLTPDLLDRLVQPPVPQRTDLRRGVIGIGLGVGLGAIGFVLGDPDAVRPMLAVGLVPLLLGLAYLVLWRLGGGKS